jgi:hypothetical protein
MSSEENSRLSFEQMRETLQHEVRELTTREQALKAELANVRDERHRYERVLHGIDPTLRPKLTPRGQGRPPRVAAEKLDQIEAYIREHPDATTVEISYALDMGKSGVTAGVAALREQERIRLTGKRTGGHGTPPNTYRVMES